MATLWRVGGAIETSICALALEKEWLPPTVNLRWRTSLRSNFLRVRGGRSAWSTFSPNSLASAE